MTNEEKTKEIISWFIPKEAYAACFYAKRVLLFMAEWKDEQFEDTKDEIKTDAKKALALEIHKKISEGATLAELDNYVCGICDF